MIQRHGGGVVLNVLFMLYCIWRHSACSAWSLGNNKFSYLQAYRNKQRINLWWSHEVAHRCVCIVKMYLRARRCASQQLIGKWHTLSFMGKAHPKVIISCTQMSKHFHLWSTVSKASPGNGSKHSNALCLGLKPYKGKQCACYRRGNFVPLFFILAAPITQKPLSPHSYA